MSAPTTHEILQALAGIDQAIDDLYDLADEWQEASCQNIEAFGASCLSNLGLQETDCVVCSTFGKITDLHQQWPALAEVVGPLQKSFYDMAQKVMS